MVYNTDMENSEVASEVIRRLNFSKNTVKYILSTEYQNKLTRKRNETNKERQELEDFFERTTKEKNRVSLNLPTSESVYRGDWLSQGRTYTCVAFSIANSIKSLGMEPNINFIADLLNNTGHDFGDPGMEVITGISFYEVLELFQTRQYKDMNVSIELSSDENNLSEVSTNPDEAIDQHGDGYEYFIGKKKVTVEEYSKYPLQDWKEHREEIIRNNAKKIKKTIENKGRYVVGVDVKFYREGKRVANGGKHAISIVGCRVSDEGIMDVQVIDSNFGTTWTSLEHLSDSINYMHSIVVKKKK